MDMYSPGGVNKAVSTAKSAVDTSSNISDPTSYHINGEGKSL